MGGAAKGIPLKLVMRGSAAGRPRTNPFLMRTSLSIFSPLCGLRLIQSEHYVHRPIRFRFAETEPEEIVSSVVPDAEIMAAAWHNHLVKRTQTVPSGFPQPANGRPIAVHGDGICIPAGNIKQLCFVGRGCDSLAQNMSLTGGWSIGKGSYIGEQIQQARGLDCGSQAVLGIAR